MSTKKFNREEIVEKVNAVLMDRLDVDENKINNEKLLKEDLKADSLDVLQIIMDLEKAFDINVSDDKIDGLSQATVGCLYDFIDDRVNGCQ